MSPAYGVYRLDQDQVLPAYCDLLYRTPAYIAEMTRYSKGIWSSRLRLYPEAFLSLSALIPPLAEQKEIVRTYLAAREPITTLITELAEGQALLSARRQALITASVTGAVDPAAYRAQPAGVAA